MPYSHLLALCDKGEWPTADAWLRQRFRETPDDADLCAMAAHAVLRTGNRHVARHLIHKAQALAPDNPNARVEDFCLDFYEARFDQARLKQHAELLAAMPPKHPAHRIGRYVECLFGADYPQPPEDAMQEAMAHLARGDRLDALITARLAELCRPHEADSFAALGLANLNAGFYANADANFHEAAFRGTRHADVVNRHHFILFCRQGRVADALTIGLNLKNAGKLDAHGYGLLLEMMLRGNAPLEKAEQLLAELKERAASSPLVEAAELQVLMGRGFLSPKEAADRLKPHSAQADCPAAYLYLWARLQAPSNLAEARNAASRALALDPLHPDAAQWEGEAAQEKLHFEYAGLFIPRQHEGGAWPTPPQMELLSLLFTTRAEKRAEAWQDFCHRHSLYTLEAGAYRLLPFVYKTLNDASAPQGELLKGIWKKSYVENALKLKHLLAVAERLDAAGIAFTLLKGLANAVPLYGDLGSRPMSDIDIYIALADVTRAHALLTADGWQAEGLPTPERMRFAYAITYRHPQGGMLDVHWRPCEAFATDYFDPADMGPAGTVEILGRRMAALSATLNLLCTILHGVEWNHLSPVRWVADALLILRNHRIDWAQMHRLAVKYHCLPPLAMGLAFLERFERMTDGMPPALANAMKQDYSQDALMNIRLRPRNIIATWPEAWAAMEHLKKRFTFTPQDHLFICGGDRPEEFRAECARRGIGWVAHHSVNALLAQTHTVAREFNLIAIDANLSCHFHCAHVRRDS